ncbi:MAG: PDZ domain-containing protein [Myxococcales bacterium]|nr:PDZ domain-containing protein [Myxococcales bacterium]
MQSPERLGRSFVILGSLGLATWLALFSTGRGEGLFRGLYSTAQAAPAQKGQKKGPYALSKALVVKRTLELISDEYVDPKRVVPHNLLLAALNSVQRDVAQVLVHVEPGGQVAKIRVEDKELSLEIKEVNGPWDVLAKIRTVFQFLELHLKDSPDIDLREVEYAACNGMLKTLDPHSVLFSPEAYKDFSVGTSGKFGGLGIVIQIRDKVLTVMNTMPGTPAAEGGLMKGDRIIQINGESTTTMGINEAVQRLRGDPDTDVTLVIKREGKDGFPSKPFKLTRKEIKVASVESKALDGGVGYIRLKQFAEQTAPDMQKAMAELKASGHDKGLVLDLRGNPGGLLDQARRVVDAFVKTGEIVIQDGRKEGRIVDDAKDDKNEPGYPIVVLVSSGSASASEIVAGALKNLDRAVIVGETTFGKGSVQKVEKNIPPEGAALKLTIAQYLTPGDISIQGVGIVPDIELLPMTVDLQELNLTADAPYYRESDLSAHLSNAKAKAGQKPVEILQYALSREDRASLRERGGDPEDQFALDAQIAFARRFLKTVSNSDGAKRLELIKKAKGFLDGYKSEELKKVEADLVKLGIDWSDGDASGAFDPSKISVVVEPSKSNGEVNAGDALELKVTVTNNGSVPLYKLRGQTKSDAGIFDGKEFVFGKVEPGKSRSWTSPLGWCETEGHKAGVTAPKDAPRVCKIPKDTVTRADVIKVKFEEAHEHAPKDAETRTTIKALARPSFAYSYAVVDDVQGNGDGQLQVGEKASLYLTVKNTGSGKSWETEASLHNLSGDGLLLRDARFDLSNMAPGEERKVRFTFDVNPVKDEAKVSLAIRDADLRESATERIVMPIRPSLSVTSASGILKVESLVDLFESPVAGGKPFGQLPKDGILGVTGLVSDYVRVDLGNGRFAFASKTAGKVGKGDPPKPKDPKKPVQPWIDLLTHSPPSIEVDAIDLVVKSDKVKLKGFAIDPDKVIDAYVFVGSRKIFYKSNKGGADAKKLPFELDVPLRPGVNFVSVWARESSDTVQRRVFVVRRDGPDGAALETPKGDEDLGELLGGGN